MTWRNSMPSYDSTNAIDYVMVDSAKGYRDWNITELVKKWYADKTSNTTCALAMMNPILVHIPIMLLPLFTHTQVLFPRL